MNRLKLVFGFSILWAICTAASGAELELKQGDHICLVGNALGERMQHSNYWETLLHQRFPALELVVRNLCLPGDEPFNRLRSLNFGSPDDHLKHSKADVVFYFFGFNESFAGKSGIAKFTADLTKLVAETRQQNYSGKGAPRIVLVSPIAHEDLGDPNVLDGKSHNLELQRYTEAMRQVARTTGVGFADLFTPTKSLFEATEQPWTINGVHLSDEGYRALAPILDRALFGSASTPSAATERTTAAINQRLKQEIDDKNFHWFHRYRAVNGYSIYGTRGEAGSDGTYRNREVMERERAILDEMCANRDRRIWALARGEAVPDKVDDSNTLPFIVPKTNVGGDGDPNRKSGKLGSLDYIPAAEQLKYFKLAPGYEINLVASEEDFPELAKPVALNFDSRGRLWVATMPSYPQWQPKTPMDDKLLILEDENGDGRADKCKVFAGGLHQPTGFELGYGGVFIAQQPDLVFLKDTDGDDRADVRIRKLTGFDTADSHHGLAAFEWGPDGALYFQEGTFKQSQVESPYGLTRMGDAGVWRYDPRTERFGVHVSLAFANPWGHVFDAWGQNFVSDASPGFNYWATPISGFVDYPDKHPGGSRAKNLDWGGSKSNLDYPVFVEKRIRPTSGCEFVASRHFPPEAQGNFLVNNVIGDLGVLQHTVHDNKSGFGGKEIPPLVMCEHGNFRPVDLQFGPDGALYIVDWHNALIGHLQHNLREPNRDHSHGRIWRVTYKDRALLTPPKIAGEPIPALLELLKSPEDRTRYRVRRELAERKSTDVGAALDKWLAGLDSDAADQHLLLETLWVYQSHNVVNEKLLKRLLESPEPRARAAVTRVLAEWRDRLPDTMGLLATRIRDPHPRVRLEAVRACSFVGNVAAMELALDVLNYEMDVFLDYTLHETIRVLEDTVHRQEAAEGRAAAVGNSGATESAHSHSAGNDVGRGEKSAPNQAKDRTGNGPASASTPPSPTSAKAGKGEKDAAARGKKKRQAEANVQIAHDHAAHQAQQTPALRPIVFLDKSPAIVAYQLARLSAAQLLLIERTREDAKFIPVFEAILQRNGVSRQDRDDAALALAQFRGSSPITECLAGIERAGKLPPSDQAIVLNELASFVLARPAAELARHETAFRQGIQSQSALLRPVAYAGLAAATTGPAAWELAKGSEQGRLDFLAAVRLVPGRDRRSALRENIVACLDESQSVAVRRAALDALGSLPAEQTANFQLAAKMVEVPALRAASVQTLLKLRAAGQPKEAQRIVDALVQYAESTPAARRTTDDFLDAMQLADHLVALLPAESARSSRERLRKVAVRVIRISTVHEEMRYDTPYFAVEAGRPVQLVLRNEDLMPHNLVITVPGKLRDVALAAASMSPQPDKAGLAFVPQSPDVLFATRMVDTHKQFAMTFTAPQSPGEYPYVCTFPNHWMRMYGVMVVVPDLDAWLAKPASPKDPLGNTRAIVQNWTIDDFLAPGADLTNALRGRSLDIGRQLFKEATCLQCHKVRGEGSAVGPELTDVLTRWKGDRAGVLREMIDPSNKIDPKYALYNVQTSDGRVYSGILTDQNAETITVITNPDNPQPQVVQREEIEQMVKASTSMMPKGLLDRFTKDEVFEVLAYLVAEGR